MRFRIVATSLVHEGPSLVWGVWGGLAIGEGVEVDPPLVVEGEWNTWGKLAGSDDRWIAIKLGDVLAVQV